MPITRAAIGELIPHAGAMCLLDQVISWDRERIVCVTHSHVSLDNPLREDGGLPAVCGVEYAGQAMAVHGALLLQRSVGSGFLAGIRQLKLFVDRLDNRGSTLTVQARRLMGGSEGMVYEFRLLDGSSVLIDGRATVVLREG